MDIGKGGLAPQILVGFFFQRANKKKKAKKGNRRFKTVVLTKKTKVMLGATVYLRGTVDFSHLIIWPVCPWI
jgi:hypothetical protein